MLMGPLDTTPRRPCGDGKQWLYSYASVMPNVREFCFWACSRAVTGAAPAGGFIARGRDGFRSCPCFRAARPSSAPHGPELPAY